MGYEVECCCPQGVRGGVRPCNQEVKADGHQLTVFKGGAFICPLNTHTHTHTHTHRHTHQYTNTHTYSVRLSGRFFTMDVKVDVYNLKQTLCTLSFLISDLP